MLALLIAGIALILIGLSAWFWQPPQRTYSVRVTGGIKGLNRHAVVEYMRRHAHEVGLAVEIVQSEGTMMATRRVQDREIDIALVNGLLRSPTASSVRHVATIATESLHLLVKEEYAEKAVADLGELRQLTINVGPVGSETEMVSRAFLAFCGVDLDVVEASNPNQLDRRGIGRLMKDLDEIEASSADRDALRRKLPDVVIHVSTMPSPLARRLIHLAGYQLVPVPFADAFARISVEEDEIDSDHLDQVHVLPATIPAFMYSVSPPIPGEHLATLGCPLIVIVHEDVPAEVVARLLPRIYEGPVKRVYQPPDLSEIVPTYPWHPASIAYRDRNKPLLRADVANFVQAFFGVVGPLVGGCLAIYGFYRWRQTLRFIAHFERLQALDMQAKGLTSDDVVTPAEAEEARRLEGQLTRLQQQAVADFCHNYFHGEGVLENFLQVLAETRDFLRTSARRANAASAPNESTTNQPDDEQ